jgi:D-alanyl-D-alanine dipeptidase
MLSARLAPLLAAALLAVPAAARLPERTPLVDVQRMDPTLRVRLSYARPENAFGERLYFSGDTALLREPVARRLARVQARLRVRGLGLLIWDAYRPATAQQRMWRLRPDPRYLASPRRGSRHTRGAAVDVTLVDAAGRALPMPTPHDEFSPRAHRGAVRGVPAAARRNAALLEAAMRAEGFRPHPREWWHFDAPDWRRYPPVPAAAPGSGGRR